MSLALGRMAAPAAGGTAWPAMPLWWWLALGPSLALLGGGVASVSWLLYDGVQVWGNDWPAVWGFEMIAYGWWLGVATGTMFVSAVLALAGVAWRASVSRIAETLAVLSIAGAGIYPILHLGRPWFFYWLFPYPNTLQLWPQFKSPLLWDFMSIITVLIASLVFWFMGMIPDLAALRDRAGPSRPGLFYGVLALGFRGAGRQWRHYRAAYAAMAALMVPLVISVQTIGALDFAGGETPGWHTTQLPAMYVCIAGLQGAAAVLAAALLFGGQLGVRALEAAPRDWLCRMMLAASLGLAYCYGNEAFCRRLRAGCGRLAGHGREVRRAGVLDCDRAELRGAAITVGAGAAAPGRAGGGLALRAGGHVARTLRHHDHQPDPCGAAFGLGPLCAQRLGLAAVRRHARPGGDRHAARHTGAADGSGLGAAMILARFHDPAAMDAAARRLAAEGMAGVESFGPAPQDAPAARTIPVVMLASGIVVAAGAFALQCYATTWGYRIDIGGRPDLFWPAYLPFAIEAGMLTAMLAGFVGFLVAAQMPALHDPVDEGAGFAAVSRDGWFLAVPGAPSEAAQDILRGAASIEAIAE